MSSAAIIIIGNEILTGKFADENAPWLIGRLRSLGVDLGRIVTIPDTIEDIAQEVRTASARFDHVFTSGGVGPTHDDLTLPGVAAALGVPVVRHPELEGILRTRMGAACNEAALRMADLPDGAELWWEGQVHWPLVAPREVRWGGPPFRGRPRTDRSPRHHGHRTRDRRPAHRGKPPLGGRRHRELPALRDLSAHGHRHDGVSR